jgi:Tfp pilus assembly protein PilF
LFNLGTIHQAQGDAAQANMLYRKVIESGHPELTPKAAVNLGFVLFNQLGDAAGAVKAFERAIAFGHPEQTKLATMNLEAMRTLAGIERIESAGLSPGTSALAQDSQRAVEHYNRARAFHSTGQLEQAIDEYRAALRLEPNYCDARGNLGNALCTKGDVDGGSRSTVQYWR